MLQAEVSQQLARAAQSLSGEERARLAKAVLKVERSDATDLPEWVQKLLPDQNP